MNILILGLIDSPITQVVQKSGCNVIECEDQIDLDFTFSNKIDFIISYRYKYLITNPLISHFKDRIINLHISLLPWNRGADPNLWSFLEDTPKGVSIHYIDEGLDTGDIIAQREIFFNEDVETLTTSYARLNREIVILFEEQWPLIKEGKAYRWQQAKGGSFHKLSDKKKYEYLLFEEGWNTLVLKIKGKALSKQ